MTRKYSRKKKQEELPLTDKQLMAIRYWSTGLYSWDAIAKIIKVHKNTLYGWRMANSVFKEKLQEQHKTRWQEEVTRSPNLLQNAMAVLIEISNNKNYSPEARIAATSEILNTVYKNMELQSDMFLRQEIQDTRKALEVLDPGNPIYN